MARDKVGETTILTNFDCVGDIVHISLVGQPIIYLNSYEVAIKLLEKRASIYSDRPLTEMAKLFVSTILWLILLILLPTGVQRVNSSAGCHTEMDGGSAGVSSTSSSIETQPTSFKIFKLTMHSRVTHYSLRGFETNTRFII
jgi:hypothetical protein